MMNKAHYKLSSEFVGINCTIRLPLEHETLYEFLKNKGLEINIEDVQNYLKVSKGHPFITYDEQDNVNIYYLNLYLNCLESIENNTILISNVAIKKAISELLGLSTKETYDFNSLLNYYKNRHSEKMKFDIEESKPLRFSVKDLKKRHKQKENRP